MCPVRNSRTGRYTSKNRPTDPPGSTIPRAPLTGDSGGPIRRRHGAPFGGLYMESERQVHVPLLPDSSRHCDDRVNAKRRRPPQSKAGCARGKTKAIAKAIMESSPAWRPDRNGNIRRKAFTAEARRAQRGGVKAKRRRVAA